MDCSTHTFVVPTSKINSVEDLQTFSESQTCKSFVAFIELLNIAATNKKISDPCTESEVNLKSIQFPPSQRIDNTLKHKTRESKRFLQYLTNYPNGSMKFLPFSNP